MLRKTNVKDTVNTTDATVTALLCDKTFSKSSNLPSDITYSEATAYTDDMIVGFSTDNVVIYNALSSSNSDILVSETKYMDQCMLSTTSSGNIIKYHTLSACYAGKGSTSKTPELAGDVTDDLLNIQKATWAALKYTSKDLPNEKIIGLAKDGHVIVGPYNSNGELWTCDETDICNGVFLKDNSYAYAATQNFPYMIGCWGPGP